jgi:hypothetical protein
MFGGFTFFIPIVGGGNRKAIATLVMLVSWELWNGQNATPFDPYYSSQI